MPFVLVTNAEVGVLEEDAGFGARYCNLRLVKSFSSDFEILMLELIYRVPLIRCQQSSILCVSVSFFSFFGMVKLR